MASVVSVRGQSLIVDSLFIYEGYEDASMFQDGMVISAGEYTGTIQSVDITGRDPRFPNVEGCALYMVDPIKGIGITGSEVTLAQLKEKP